MTCIVYPDCLFSNWILIWYILFICQIVKFNPKYFIFFALVFNFCQLLMKIKNKSSIKNILVFILLVSIFKLLPFLSILSIDSVMSDILFGIFLFFLYLLYVYINYKTKRLDPKMFEVLFMSDKKRECKSFFEYITNNFSAVLR